MQSKEFQLLPEDLERLSQLDASITQWSLEHTKMVLNMRRLESGLDTFFESRRQVTVDRMKALGIDTNRVMQVNVVDDDGHCVATLSEPSAAPEVSPVAPPVVPPTPVTPEATQASEVDPVITQVPDPVPEVTPSNS